MIIDNLSHPQLTKQCPSSLDNIRQKACKLSLFSPCGTPLKGNLTHKFMDVYSMCLSFHLDICNRLETKPQWNYWLTYEPQSIEGPIWKSP